MNKPNLNVPVMNGLRYNDKDLQRMIANFKADGITFGLFERVKGSGKYELWRKALPGDLIVNHKHGANWDEIVEAKFPDYDDFTYVWEGKTMLKGIGAA